LSELIARLKTNEIFKRAIVLVPQPPKIFIMKKHLLLSLILIFPLLAISQNTHKVLIIGVDGCRADALQVANTPNIDALISNGVFSPDALNDDITISGPGWSAILCGVWSDKHLVTGNNFSGNNYATYPPVFKHIEDTDPSLNTASICHWAPINNSIVQNHADFKMNVTTDAAVSSEAVDYISQNDPDLIFLHFDDVDHAGHSHGFSPNVPQYITAIEIVDSQIEPIITAIEARPNYASEDWLILLSSDHGGVGNSHGGTSIEHQNVVAIASGNSIAQSEIFKDSTIVIDNPFNCLGDTIELQFDGANDNVQIPSDSLFNFGTTQDFTIECRVRTVTSGDVAIIGNKDWNSGSNKGFVFSFKYPSGPEWKVNIGDGNNRADINTGGFITDNEWHTLSVSFDRDGLMKMYEDGVFLTSTSISNIGDITTNQGLFFGTDINSAFDYNGSIAEVRVWSTILDASTISSWHCTSIENNHPDYPDLIGYWKLNEGMGMTQAIDYSANNNDGSINNAIWHDPDTIVTYDYSNTPRIVDIPYTALTHLCIPIKPSWQLDGNSLIPDNCVLPIELISFKGKATYNAVLLEWTTASEQNNDSFRIEHSENGKDFFSIGFMPGKGNAMEKNQYKFFHGSPVSGQNYYRLKQTDIDGSYRFSEIITAGFKNQKELFFSIYPTAAEDTITVETSEVENDDGIYFIYAKNGELIKKLELKNLINPIDISQFSSGQYYIQKGKSGAIQLFIKI
jgi:hypothetical protein